MKNLLLLLVLTIGCTFAACNKDNDATPEPFITATIDGQAFEADIKTAISDSSLGEEIIFINGSDTDTQDEIVLIIPISVPLNTAIAIDQNDFALSFTDADENAFFTVGTITITENNESESAIGGTFSFTATDDANADNVREVTNGEFYLVYE